MRIDFLGIQAFAAIAERGSFRLAAAHLNLSQTALSHRIRKLEADLGAKLFSRAAHGVSLTPVGAQFLQRVKGSLEDFSDAVESLRKSGEEKTKQISIGCLPSITPSLMESVLPAFHARHPDVYVRICDNEVQELDNLVTHGTIEFAVSLAMAYRSDFDVTVLGRENFVLICPRGTQLPQDNVGWDNLHELPMIRINSRSDNRQIIDDALAGRRDTINWRYEVRRVHTAIALVEAGLACAAVPSLALDTRSTSRLQVVQLRNPSVARQICTISKKDEPMSPLAAELYRLTARSLGDQLTSSSRRRERTGA
ncbi:LysR substrate-binding domain-containing protein [Mesorhizobium sp. CAU 1741]|uniref:LysR family transcriptional regulator n=1 Tax=Mesorhizobium sp. CAU 1741 TaxID=3140366 RepID=UPI00325AB97D